MAKLTLTLIGFVTLIAIIYFLFIRFIRSKNQIPPEELATYKTAAMIQNPEFKVQWENFEKQHANIMTHPQVQIAVGRMFKKLSTNTDPEVVQKQIEGLKTLTKIIERIERR